MRPLTRGLLALSLLLFSSAAACRGRPADPPYLVEQGPNAEELLALTAPPLRAIQVPKAKIRQGRKPAATLMLAAQKDPVRFAGSISAAGNELVSLAVNEKEYGLRWLRDEGLRAGFYRGPPSPCAIERALGIDLSPDELVSLLLAGAPIIDGARVVGQRWEGARIRRRERGNPGHEVIALEGDGHAQELRFAWQRGRWWLAGTSLWRLDGSERHWLWTVEHEELRLAGDVMLPGKTRISRPGKDEPIELTITYLEQRPDPPALLAGANGAGGDEVDSWEDEGWEDDEDEPAPEPAPPASPITIPAVFQVDASGLTSRGDLCTP